MDFAFTKGARELFTYEEGQSRISCVLEYKRYGWGWLLPFHLYWNMNAMVGVGCSHFLCVETVPSVHLERTIYISIHKNYRIALCLSKRVTGVLCGGEIHCLRSLGSDGSPELLRRSLQLVRRNTARFAGQRAIR